MKPEKNTTIPRATAKRLSLYYRIFKRFNSEKIDKANSKQIADAIGIDSATVRRDFSYFGELGKRGYGYDVEDLMHFFAKTLNDDQLTNVALIGVGNLGSALLKYKFHQSNSIRISCAFDVNEEIVGRIVDGIPVYPMEDMSEQIKIQQIEVAILTIPAERAQEVVNQLTEAGIKGILNFTAARLNAPSDVLIQNVDLTNELQTLIYFLHSDANAHSENTAE